MAVFAILAATGWLIQIAFLSFFFVFQTVDDILGFYLNPKKAKKSFLLRIAIIIVSLKVVLTGSVPDIWRIIAGIIFTVGYCSGLVVSLSNSYIKMVGLAKKLSQSELFREAISELSTSGEKRLTLCQHERGARWQEIKPGDLINIVAVVDVLLKDVLSGNEIDYPNSYQKSLVAMAMMMTQVADIFVLDYSETFSIMRMDKAITGTKINKKLARLAKKLGYTIVRQRIMKVRPSRQQAKDMVQLLIGHVNSQWTDLPLRKLSVKLFKPRNSFFVQYFSQVISLQGNQSRSILGNEPREDAEKFINCSDLTLVKQAFEDSGAQAILPSLVYGRQELFLSAVLKTGKACYISNLIGYRGLFGDWQTTEIKPRWKVLRPVIQAILSGYRPIKTIKKTKKKKEVPNEEPEKKGI